MPSFFIPKINLINLRGNQPEIVTSKLFDDYSFYDQFIKDLKSSKKEVIIESPFISSHRMYSLLHFFRKLVTKRVKCYVFTRDPNEHSLPMKEQAETEIRKLESLGIQIIISTKSSHRKLAIIDREILWEGSLNILSQTYSLEFMRRIKSHKQAQQCFDFARYGTFIY